MHPRRVVVTGMGTITPLGLDVPTTWAHAVAGRSGAGPITLFDASRLNVRIAAEVKGFDPLNYMDAREARRRDRFEQFAVAATQEAVRQAGLRITEEIADEVGVIIGSAIGGAQTFADGVETARYKSPRLLHPFVIPMVITDGASAQIAIALGARGPNFATVSACAAGADAIGIAYELICSGDCRVCIAGGAEASITFVGIAAFDRIGAMSRRNDDPAGACRPFDRDRDGTVMGEGAAILVLEDLEFARARGAEPLAEIIGYGATSDAYHPIAPDEDGAGAARAMTKALRKAGIRPGEVDYINAHGTGTPLNDKTETLAIKMVFGERAYEIPVSATKSMTGHMIGATGALEAIFCIMAIREGILPPTINLQNPDPECDLDYVPNQARRKEVRIAITNAFGFGGHNSVLVLKRWEGV